MSPGQHFRSEWEGLGWFLGGVVSPEQHFRSEWEGLGWFLGGVVSPEQHFRSEWEGLGWFLAGCILWTALQELMGRVGMVPSRLYPLDSSSGVN